MFQQSHPVWQSIQGVKDHEGKKLRRYVEQLIAHDIFESQEETVIEPYESNF